MQRANFAEQGVMLLTILQWLVLATATGAIVGTGTSFFLHGLFFSINQTASVPLPAQMLLLVAGGFANGLVLHSGYRLNRSGLHDTLFAAINTQQGRMPFRTLWIKPVAAIITLASGGSAGKEGPCSHIGASLASIIGSALRLNTELRLRLVACGVSAGFASVFGTPFAGAIYGVEVLAIGRIRHDFLLPAVAAGASSYYVSRLWQIPYQYYTFDGLGGFSELIFTKLIVVGLLCGLAALLFVKMVQGIGHLRQSISVRYRIWPPFMPMLGGVLISLLILVIPVDYLGLSLPLIDRSIAGEPMPYLGFFYKILLVAITIGSGFYGGIVTPQFVIGAVAGGAFAPLLGMESSLGAAIGLISVVAAASNTPISAILMAVELFHGTIPVIYVAGAAVTAYLIIGHHSIYPQQRLAFAKSSWMRIRPESAVSEEKARLSYGLLRLLGIRDKSNRNRKP